jgi:hypothetical protein
MKAANVILLSFAAAGLLAIGYGLHPEPKALVSPSPVGPWTAYQTPLPAPEPGAVYADAQADLDRSNAVRAAQAAQLATDQEMARNRADAQRAHDEEMQRLRQLQATTDQLANGR